MGRAARVAHEEARAKVSYSFSQSSIIEVVVYVRDGEVRAGIYVSAGGLDPDEWVEVGIGDFLQMVYGLPQFDLEANSSFQLLQQQFAFPQASSFRININYH
jgi:hypothetical protein